ncbi:ciliogenesis-associated TTC17-interacting protein-like [Sycon ciliatum]|uniref:ciliogenesis-associated TTC17-interacting protein-like n=1 Tax=Sycon ciliatum TaxID=27933 RepID=UPI0020A9B555|eukprot:scpid80595/ scgid18508/ Uncharacterized protein C2orf62 homolog
MAAPQEDAAEASIPRESRRSGTHVELPHPIWTVNSYASFAQTEEGNTGSGADGDGGHSYLPPSHDLEMQSRQTELYTLVHGDLAEYYKDHPELDAMLKDFMLLVLQQKPSDVFAFARDYFATFSKQPHAPAQDGGEAVPVPDQSS